MIARIKTFLTTTLTTVASWVWKNILWIIVIGGAILFMINYWGSPPTPVPGTSAPGLGQLFLKLAIVVLIVAAVISRGNGYLPYVFCGLAVLILVVLLGKLDTLFSWGAISLPLFAVAGFYGAYKFGGRNGAFLGFASGVVIVAWFIMFAQSTLKIDLGFLGNRITGDKLLIFFLAAGLFVFATWKRSKFVYVLAFLVVASWIGNGVFENIKQDYPKLLTPPSVSEKTKDTWEEVWDAFLSRVKEAVKSEPKSPAPTPVPAPVVSATPPKKELRHHVEKRSLEVQPPDGKGVMLKAEDVPWAKNARYQVVFRLTQNRPGKLFIEVNGHKEEGGRPFDFDHRITDQEVKVVFFDNVPGGLRGDPKYFVPGTNWIKFSSPGINVNICYARIEVEYWS